MSDQLIEDIKDKTKEEKQQTYFHTISNILVNTINEYKMRHILVYCASHSKVNVMINELKNITDDQSNYNIGSILSDDSKTKRDKAIKSFEKNDDDIHILFSISIFDEGIDIKCTDAVFFSEERFTESRIVQNVGRCLRIDPNNQDKKNGYVIIPNIVQITNIDNDNELNDEVSLKTYSKSFVKIREVLEKMKASTSTQYWGKYVRGHEDIENDDIETDGNKLIKHNNDNIFPNDNIIDLSEYYVQESTHGSIANISLDSLKKIKPKKVTTIKDWALYVKNKNIPYLYLHKEFKSDWICWGDFLCCKTYEYSEVKDIIKQYFEGKFKIADEWIEYYDDLIRREFIDMRKNNITDEMVNNLIKIPNKPGDYYKGEWISWNDFLGIDAITINNMIAPSGVTTNNNEKIMNGLLDNQIKKDVWLTHNMGDELIESLKKYIINDIGIVKDPKHIELRVRIRNNKNGSLNKCCILCIENNGDYTNAPIILWPEESKISYDQRIFMKGFLSESNKIKVERNEKYKREKTRYIRDKKLLKDIDIMMDNIKKTCKQLSHFEDVQYKNDNYVVIKNNDGIPSKQSFDAIAKPKGLGIPKPSDLNMPKIINKQTKIIKSEYANIETLDKIMKKCDNVFYEKSKKEEINKSSEKIRVIKNNKINTINV